MSPARQSTHRIRIVCVSDTHNSFPKLPSGDILIHAGDLTNQGGYTELLKTVEWLDKADFKLKIIVAGNHDITLDRAFYEEYGRYFHNQQPYEPQDCIDLLANTPSLTYLDHETRTLQLENACGTATNLKVFGSPYSPNRGLWAFGYPPEDAARKWADIPLDADIVITHTPPKFHCDESPSRGAAGCEDLRRALWRVRPRIAVCGHVHEARGAESVLWDLEAPHVRYKELETFYWNDGTGASKRQFKIDLTSCSMRPLQNDGVGQKGGLKTTLLPSGGREVSLPEHLVEYGSRTLGALRKSQYDGAVLGGEAIDAGKTFPALGLAESPTPPTLRSGPCDFEALAGREGRKETCIINAAITGSSWPHPTGKKWNKPIVVDIELPAENFSQVD
jgi:Calcineurin-like phosphoesterase